MSKKSEIGKNQRRRARNRLAKERIKAGIIGLRKAAGKGDAALAEEKLGGIAPALDRAARKGPLHKNTAARKKARLATKVNTLKQGSSEPA